MTKKIIITAVVLGLAFAGYKFFFKKDKAPAVTYSQVAAFKGSIKEMIDTTGEVSALNRVEIKPSVAGRVDKLLVKEGDDVKKGQILAYLSSSDRVAILDAVRTNEKENLAVWENTYKPTPVISPMNGRIILRAVVEGQTISTNDVLYALADELIVVASVDEADIGRVKVGQETFITLDAYQDSSVEGKVFQILEEGKNVSNVITYYVKIRPYKVPAFFKSLMTANIEITIAHHNDVVLLPWLAVQEDKQGKSYVLTGDNAAQTRKDVKTGLSDGTNIEILRGLKEGDNVLVKAAKYQGKETKEAASSFIQMGRTRKTNSEILGGSGQEQKQNGRRQGNREGKSREEGQGAAKPEAAKSAAAPAAAEKSK